MNSQNIFCPNYGCPARGQTGKGNIHPHSKSEKRYACDVCQTTFSTTKGTIFYRLKTNPEKVMLVLALLSRGCSIEAITFAFGFDPRTVKSWWVRAGHQCEAFHEHTVGQAKFDMKHVQADEIRVKMWGIIVWLGLAIMVSNRLWLGGVVSISRNKNMIDTLVAKIRQVALCRPLLIAVDGLPHYIGAIERAFRIPVKEKKLGRPKLISWPNVHIGQVIKRKENGKFSIERRLKNAPEETVATLIETTQGKSGVLNTAYIERFNATCRQRLVWLTRRSRVLAHKPSTITSGMYIVGCIYNFCDPHKSLRMKLSVGSRGSRWIQRTPALAAGLANHIWSYQELLSYRVPPPRWQPPKKRGRQSKEMQKLIAKWC